MGPIQVAAQGGQRLVPGQYAGVLGLVQLGPAQARGLNGRGGLGVGDLIGVPAESGELPDTPLADATGQVVLLVVGEELEGSARSPLLAHEEHRCVGRQEHQGGGGCQGGVVEDDRGTVSDGAVAYLVVVGAEDHEAAGVGVLGHGCPPVPLPEGGPGAVVEEGPAIGLGPGADLGEVAVVALILPGESDVQGVVDVVGPLGGHAQARDLGRRLLTGGGDDPDVVEVGLGHQAQGASELDGQGGHGVRELGQNVPLRRGGGCGVVLDLVDGVQAQGVDVEVPHPAQGGVDDEGAHLLTAVVVVVDGLAPGSVVGGGEVGSEDAEVVARWTQVVVDDVEAHADAGVVGGVDEAGQGVGAAVCLVDGPQSHPVVAPAGLAGEGRQRHELNDVDAQIDQVSQA